MLMGYMGSPVTTIGSPQIADGHAPGIQYEPWRIIFRFEGTDAFDVELIDYH